MGDIINFQRLERSAAPMRAIETGASASIHFFTGVRYERHSEPETSQPANAPSRGGLNGAGGGRRKRRG